MCYIVFCNQHVCLGVCTRACVFVCTALLCGTADAEIKILSAETPELTNVPHVKPAEVRI